MANPRQEMTDESYKVSVGTCLCLRPHNVHATAALCTGLAQRNRSSAASSSRHHLSTLGNPLKDHAA